MAEAQQPFLTDITEIRRRAREHLEEGAITEDYEGDVNATIKLLNDALATEIVCVLRYTYHYVAAVGIQSESVKDEFGEHAREEQQHALRIAERINQLGGKADFNPEGLLTRSASQYAEGQNLVDMIKENLIAERIAIQTYQEMVRYFANHDPTTRRMMEDILAKEEEHANDMHDLLVAHQGKPPLRS
ncbi:MULTISPECIES: ferritin-like domain-containing protein [Myxococcus]|uniref:Bacterioferritin n=1 Tax=Myxococcus xanthus TaxID=34 RepID=A0AAE6KSA4_MYXXA|nr:MULTISPECIES: ferritin-like domain-containing protein [Myxococcus]QDE67974.1 bacterioferritin [Myxococcus xanthus]QDE75251.1 bacterioferritin [Myxococcus xanthus]QDE82553.1 bacterioferritin [Myxococcus xanthus]QDE96825.1 bacterioferritin [Myxococcus xanthus]QDF04356.1 bacterioferritin [Myxococcus xanthus]